MQVVVLGVTLVRSARMPIRVGVDIGGTFTDFVVYDGASGSLESFKRLSTPHAPELAVLDGLSSLGLDSDSVVVHGSTVATNAVLERKGARTAFVTTEGFRDLLTIGRQNRESLYDFMADRPEPLVPPAGCFGVAERVGHHGQVVLPLQAEEIPNLLSSLQQYGAESVALCLLFSFLRPDHEQQIAKTLREAGLAVSTSSELLPEFREVERASTTTLNAYVMPVMDRYLGKLEAGLGTNRLQVMQSNGGRLNASQARGQPIRAILSGPAGGVIGALSVAQRAGFQRVITFDMGGTSTDVALATGGPQLTSEGQIGGLPVRLPMLDIHTIGSGGGSIARVDRGGSLRVGPQSAGASPGPACYGLGGTEPTVSDANLVLGRMIADRFLGGKLPLDSAAAHRVIDRLGAQLGMPAGPDRAIQSAGAVVQVVNAQMARAIRLVSVERGHDPRGFVLVSFGGAGGLHACELARSSGIGTVLIPRQASTLSAHGMLVADPTCDFVQTVMLPGETDPAEVAGQFGALEAEARRILQAEGMQAELVTITRELDLRYRGQSYELTIALSDGFRGDFDRAHQHAYGYSDPAITIEIVNLRLRAVGQLDKPQLIEEALGPADPAAAFLGERQIHLDGVEPVRRLTSTFDGAALRPGHRVIGPALVVYPDTTLLLPSGDRAMMDGYRNLIVEVQPE
ncbi:MAG: hydantoinase/oxoprolinase family protein [Anaerolineales bacterium]